MNLLAGRNFKLALFLIVVCLLCGSIDFGVEAEKEIPITRFSQNGGYPTMSFLYCYSCGYQKAFQDYVKIILEKYPLINIIGANYDPPGLNMYFSKVTFIAKILLIVVIVSSFDLFGAMGRATPSWWRHLLDNKLYSCMMIFFLGNMLEAQLVSSGAFEITFNDVPVWSKLQTGRLPAPQELFQIIDNQLQFADKMQENPDFAKDANFS